MRCNCYLQQTYVDLHMMIMMLMMMMMMMDSTQHLGVRSLYVMSRADLTLPSGWVPRHTSAEASIWAQCATPTDLLVEEISWRLLKTSGELSSGYH